MFYRPTLSLNSCKLLSTGRWSELLFLRYISNHQNLFHFKQKGHIAKKSGCVGGWLLALPRAQMTRLSRILGVWFTYYVPVLINFMTPSKHLSIAYQSINLRRLLRFFFLSKAPHAINWWTNILTYWWTNWLTDWLTSWLADWLTDLPTNWLSDCLNSWLLDWWLIYWLTNWLTNWLTYWLINWLNDWLMANWQTDGLIDWLADLLDWLSGWLYNLLTDGMTNWLADGLTCWLS